MHRDDRIDSDDVYDLLSVGGGLAGIVAGARAAELGLRSIVLEAGREERYACNSRYAGGIFHASYQDVCRDSKTLRMGLARAQAQDPELADVIAQDAGRALQWLRTHGVRFIYFAALKRGPWVMAPPRSPVTDNQWANRGPDLTLRTLTAYLQQCGGRLARGTRVVDLIYENQCCAGVMAQTEQGTVRYRSNAVVLADGGFAGNDAMFRDHIGPNPEAVVQRGAGTGQGDGLRLAQEAGAELSELRRFYGHLLSRDALHNKKLWPYPQVDALAAAGIVVNGKGERFMDEGLGGIYASNLLASLSQPDDSVAIVDRTIWETAGRVGLVPPNPLLERHGATIHRAETIEALAARAGLPAATVVETVRRYNNAVAQNDLQQLQPGRTQAKGVAMAIQHAPFMAIPLSTGITNTMGGPRINGHAQIVRPGGHPIDGLYAAGATAGGLEGGENVAYIGGLVKAVVFGLRAAEHAAARHEQVRAVPG